MKYSCGWWQDGTSLPTQGLIVLTNLPCTYIKRIRILNSEEVEVVWSGLAFN